jgi:hypothetical protein
VTLGLMVDSLHCRLGSLKTDWILLYFWGVSEVLQSHNLLSQFQIFVGQSLPVMEPLRPMALVHPRRCRVVVTGLLAGDREPLRLKHVEIAEDVGP